MNAITTRTSLAATTALPTAGSLGDIMRLAEMLSRSTMIPKDYVGKPANIALAVLWGAEVGLGPLQAIQGIAVIGGRPAIWGDAALALVRSHPACVSICEGVAGEGDDRHGWCETTRRDQPTERREFSIAQAKKAGLWGKPGPWQQYPDRMLQLRARGFAIRDVFADALRGVITVEEATDLPTEPREVPNLTREALLAPLPTPPDWRAMNWPIRNRDGTCRDTGDPDAFECEHEHRIRLIQDHPKLSPEAKLDTLRAVLDANREIFDYLRERGHGDVIEGVEGAFAEALEVANVAVPEPIDSVEIH